jgi:hypothetical protein
MAEESHPIKTLTAARDRLVEERRSLAGAIALGYPAPAGTARFSSSWDSSILKHPTTVTGGS